jgi:hypothetical protein
MPSTKEVVKCKFVMLGGARSFEIQYFPEAATQTFKRGDAVGLTSGKVRCNISAGSDLTSSDDEICGVALVDASGVTDTSIPVVVLDGNIGWVLPMTHATPASAITAITDQGTLRTLERTAAGDWSVTETTSGAVVEIYDIHPQYAVGEQYGWVIVKAMVAERLVGA